MGHSKLFDDLIGAVVGIVADDDPFLRQDGLAGDGVKRFGYVFCLIPSRGDEDIAQTVHAYFLTLELKYHPQKCDYSGISVIIRHKDPKTQSFTKLIFRVPLRLCGLVAE